MRQQLQIYYIDTFTKIWYVFCKNSFLQNDYDQFVFYQYNKHCL